MLYILGHKNPDCDSACTPKVYEWYLRKKRIEAEAILQGKLNNESKWVFKNFDIEPPKELKKIPTGSKVIVVDTTEPAQLPDNLEELEIIEIWDHHKLGGLKTSKPLKVVVDVIGCTSTLLFEKFEEEDLEIEKSIAGLIFSAIISDTLNLTGPTTTDRDKEAIKKLQKILRIDIKQHVKEQFEAKSSLGGMSIAEIVNFDSKDFDMAGRKVKIGVFETVDTSQVLQMRDKIKKFMISEKSQKSYDYSFYFAVDVLKNFAVPIIISDEEKEVLEAAFNQKIIDKTKLKGIVSRKKQIVPPVEEFIVKD